MTNIVMLAKDRDRLTEQAVESLYRHAPMKDFTLTIVDDASHNAIIGAAGVPNIAVLRIENSKGIVGQARNLGIYWSEKFFGRGDYLYLSDNDVYFCEGWLARLKDVFEFRHLAVMGGQRHPFHQPNVNYGNCIETDAVAGYSQFMLWQTWDRFGPFEAHAPGVCQSEDWKFCNDITKTGGKVGYIHPRVILHTGITNTFGKPAVGADQIERVPGVLYE